MKFLEYANKTQSNIIPKENFEELIQETFSVISENMVKSLGPLGSSTTILDGLYTSATKDGHTIFKSLRFRNRYKSMIYNLISAPCNRLNNTVGDGTTTAIVLANNLFQQYRQRRFDIDINHRLPREFISTWDRIIGDLIYRIQAASTPLDPNDSESIYNICYVSSNGNREISANIRDTYQRSRSPIIKVKNSPTNKSYVEPIVGFEFPANLIDDAYARNEDLSVELDEICVMIFDYKIDATICQNLIIPINEILKAAGPKKLLVLAPSYDALLANTVLKQYVNMEYQKSKDLNLILAQYALGKLAPNQLTDLATVLRAVVINQELGNGLLEEFVKDQDQYDLVQTILGKDTYEYYRVIGKVSNAMLSCTDGSIFRPQDIDNDDRYMDALRAAHKELDTVITNTDAERVAFAFEVAKAQARVSQLKMENFIYYVGADSALQKEILEHAVTDVIKCVSSSVKSGTVPGCQLTILKACNDMLTEIIDTIIGDDGQPVVAKLSNQQKLQIIILEMIRDSVIKLYQSVLNGPQGDGMIKLIDLWWTVKEEHAQELLDRALIKCGDIIKESMEKNQVFDLESLDFSEKIITSAETDINVLMASSELVKLLISGNQCVFLDAEINDAHDDTIPVYT